MAAFRVLAWSWGQKLSPYNPYREIHENVKKAVEAARSDWLHDGELLNAIVDAIKSAEHASAQVMNLLNSMVEAKFAHQ